MAMWSYQAPKALTDEQYERWQELLEKRAGICFMQHKLILQTGLSKRMREIGVDDYEQYFEQVSKVPEGAVEWSQLVDRISVKETSFFREPNSYDAVRDYLLNHLDPHLREQDNTLEIWSVGCSTGEEAYSLAMVATDMIDYMGSKVFVGVTATDISTTALSHAREAIYKARKLMVLPQESKSKYFKELGGELFQILPSLQEKLCFTQGNILELDKAPAMKMDVIFCQNVLVYFRRWRLKSVLNMFVDHLKPGGLLMLGPGEVTSWRHPLMRRLDNDLVQAYVRIDA